MDEAKRLVENLDDLDRSVAKSAGGILFLSAVYISLYFGGLKETPKVAGIVFTNQLLFYIGIPMIFSLLQYQLIAASGTQSYESCLVMLDIRYDPKSSRLRVPTVFSLLFLFGTDANSYKRKIVLWFHVVFVTVGSFLLPVVAMALIWVWLSDNDTPRVFFWVSSVLGAVGAIEAMMFAFASVKQMVKVVYR